MLADKPPRMFWTYETACSNYMPVTQASRTSPRELALISAASAWLLLILGTAASLITLARGSYTPFLLAAIFCAILATLLLAFAAWRGGIVSRILAFLGIAPIVFIISEFIRRI